MLQNRIVTALLWPVMWLIHGADTLLIRTVVPISVWLTQRGFPKSRQHFSAIVGAETSLVLYFLVSLMQNPSQPAAWLIITVMALMLLTSVSINRKRLVVDQEAERRGALSDRDVPYAVGRAFGWGLLGVTIGWWWYRPAQVLNLTYGGWAILYTTYYYLHLAPRFPPARTVREPAPRLATDAA